ncbi:MULTISPECIES: helix-turn-helix domain-containing protein [unclassified Halomonas]|uniref:helix-turn-helix domain-containing protein n=1 Tax=unclassified Halomonas TaxID=2609666 RepID=UPI001866BBA4|nr:MULTISPECIES: helix-turn-helix domain-containing protein [unclassified Halomonas]
MSTKHLSPELLNARRKQAVQLRLDGYTVAVVSQQTGLSAPTVSAAWKAFREGGWAAVPVKPRGRLKGQANVLSADVQSLLWQALFQQPAQVSDQVPSQWAEETPHLIEPGWSSAGLAEWLAIQNGVVLSQRAIEHWWEAQGLKHEPWKLSALATQRSQQGRWFRTAVAPRFNKLKEADQRWQGGVRHVAHPTKSLFQIYLHGSRGRLLMRCFESPPDAQAYLSVFAALNANGVKVLVFQGALLTASPEITDWLAQQTPFCLVPVPANLALSA